MRIQSTLVSLFALAPLLLVAASGEGSFKKPAGLIRRSTAYKAYIPRTLQEGRKKRQETCAAEETACGTGCCAAGSTCADEATATCCPAEDPTCAQTPSTCTDPTYVACADFDFCCPTGETCSVDATGEPQCGDGTDPAESGSESESGTPVAPTPGTTSRTPVGTTTRSTTTRLTSSTPRSTAPASTSATPNGAVGGFQVGSGIVAAVMAVVVAAAAL